MEFMLTPNLPMPEYWVRPSPSRRSHSRQKLGHFSKNLARRRKKNKVARISRRINRKS